MVTKGRFSAGHYPDSPNAPAVTVAPNLRVNLLDLIAFDLIVLNLIALTWTHMTTSVAPMDTRQNNERTASKVAVPVSPLSTWIDGFHTSPTSLARRWENTMRAGM